MGLPGRKAADIAAGRVRGVSVPFVAWNEGGLVELQ